MSSTQIGQDMVESLQRLIAELNESRDFYETAVQNAHETRLKDMFEQRAQQRDGFIDELEGALAQYGEDEAVESDPAQPLLTLAESIQRGLMTVKAAMTIERDKTDETLLQECQAAEKRLLASYKTLLTETDWPTSIAATLSHQYEQVQVAYAYIDSTYIRSEWAVAVGLFQDTAVAHQTITALKEAGFAADDISLVSQGDDKKEVAESLREDIQETTIETAGAGALGGGAVGTVFGLTAGAGVALVTGPLVAALGITAIGAGIGATYGGIFGTLIGMGIGEEDVQRYLEGIRRGETLLAVKASPEQASAAAGILRQHDASSVMIRHDSFGEAVVE